MSWRHLYPTAVQGEQALVNLEQRVQLEVEVEIVSLEHLSQARIAQEPVDFLEVIRRKELSF